MRHLVQFVTSKFDPSKEPRNESNPIPGKSALDWLRSSVLTDGFTCTEPSCEDWGWYMDVTMGGASYMVGATCHNEYEEPPRPGRYEWTLQVQRNRSFLDQILGRNRLREDDPLSARIFAAAEADGQLEAACFEKDA